MSNNSLLENDIFVRSMYEWFFDWYIYPVEWTETIFYLQTPENVALRGTSRAVEKGTSFEMASKMNTGFCSPKFQAEVPVRSTFLNFS